MMPFADLAAPLRAELMASYEAGELDPDGVQMVKGGAASDGLGLGYGKDISLPWDELLGGFDCSETMDEIDPESAEAVGQAAMRFLMSPDGGPFYDESWNHALGESANSGFDLSRMLSIGTHEQTLNAAQGLAAAALVQHDDRIKSAKVTLTLRTAREFDVLVYLILNSGEEYSNVMVLTIGSEPK